MLSKKTPAGGPFRVGGLLAEGRSGWPPALSGLGTEAGNARRLGGRCNVRRRSTPRRFQVPPGLVERPDGPGTGPAPPLAPLGGRGHGPTEAERGAAGTLAG
jgi:hypothetical protein